MPGLPKVLSFFSGAGGLDLGFSQAGFRTAFATDFFPAAIQTIENNGLAKSVLCRPIEKFSVNYLRSLGSEIISEGDHVGIIGGPPCQGFSRANNSSTRDDPRNSLAKRYIDLIAKIDLIYPVDFVVFENVLGIKDKKHLDTYRRLVTKLKKAGFIVSEIDLIATSFRVPQKRHRVFIIASRIPVCLDGIKDGDNQERVPTVRDAIFGLPEPDFFDRSSKYSGDRVHPNHWTMKPKSPRFSMPREKWRPSRSFKVLEWENPSPTVAFGNREIHIHPSAKRRISIYEAMRLQGFPDSFVMSGNLSDQVEQVSNAVPPPMAYAIAKRVASSLRRGGHG